MIHRESLRPRGGWPLGGGAVAEAEPRRSSRGTGRRWLERFRLPVRALLRAVGAFLARGRPSHAEAQAAGGRRNRSDLHDRGGLERASKVRRESYSGARGGVSHLAFFREEAFTPVSRGCQGRAWRRERAMIAGARPVSVQPLAAPIGSRGSSESLMVADTEQSAPVTAIQQARR